MIRKDYIAVKKQVLEIVAKLTMTKHDTLSPTQRRNNIVIFDQTKKFQIERNFR